MTIEFEEYLERHSDVDGFTVVARKDRRPRIHLLRPWNECNTTHLKSGNDTIRVKGSRENLLLTLVEMGYRHGGIACRRCFRYDSGADVTTPVTELGDAEITETIAQTPEVTTA